MSFQFSSVWLGGRKKIERRERERGARWRRICETSLRKYAQLNFSTPVSPPSHPGPLALSFVTAPLFAPSRSICHPPPGPSSPYTPWTEHREGVASPLGSSRLVNTRRETGRGRRMMADFPSLGFFSPLPFLSSFLLPLSLSLSLSFE